MPATSDLVWIRKVKRPGGSGLWGAYDLGTDVFGTWLFTPGGSLYRGEDGTTWGTCEVSQSSPGGLGRPTVYLVPTAGWWIACWRGPEPIHRVDIDISTPPRLVDRVWVYVDLELDPFVTQQGETGCQDVDEFVAACDARLISAEEERCALAAAAELDTALRSRTPPFDATGDDRLADAVALGLAPLTDLSSHPVFAQPTDRAG